MQITMRTGHTIELTRFPNGAPGKIVPGMITRTIVPACSAKGVANHAVFPPLPPDEVRDRVDFEDELQDGFDSKICETL